MGSDFNQNSENDPPEWLRGMSDGNQDAGFENGDPFPSDSSDSEELPDWMQTGDLEEFAPREEPKEEIPDWLTGIREAEHSEDRTFLDEEVPEDDSEAWLESIRERHEAETEKLKRQRKQDEQDTEDYLERVRKLKAEDESAWGDPPSGEDDPEDEIAATWAAEPVEISGDLEEVEEDVPDWLSGLPTLDPAEPARSEEETTPEESGEQDTPGWLKDMRQQSDIIDQSEEEEELAEEAEVEEDSLPHVAPLSDPPPTTSSLPAWLENLQTAGLVLPSEMREEGEEAEEEVLDTSKYIDEDVSSILMEPDDLPDWLGEGVQEAEDEEEEEETVEEPQLFDQPQVEDDAPAEEVEIEKAELPTWLQAMRPVEAVTSVTEVDEEEEITYREQEKVGPLSGLSDVLPAEPHVVHFGEQAAPIPGFSLTDTQKRYSKLLLSLVEQETKSPPAERRKVALPQQILRWVIAVVLLMVLVFVLWFNTDFFGMPTTGIPEENLAVISAVNNLSPGQRVLVAFEYQPAFSGEMQAASAAIIDHLLLRGVELVLFSSQPIGPGLAESFLQERFAGHDYIREERYVNLGYLSGGTAALLNFAGNPRRAMPSLDASGLNLWDQPPLDGITTAKDFSLVLVITDDPDMARSWVEQVHPILDPAGDGSGTPLIMAISAQAEPLVYPYYLTSPHQVSGYVSGMGGGAFYESQSTMQSVASQYWNAYNVGLLLTALVIAIGAILNLARHSLSGIGKGRV
jgi:hypothetical protein